MDQVLATAARAAAGRYPPSSSTSRVAAKVVDHVIPHRRDWNTFVTGELRNLCEPCHNLRERQVELYDYRPDIGQSSASLASSRVGW